MAQNKDGFIVPCILMVKILPTLEEGVQFVGFLKEKHKYHCLPYAYENNEIEHYIIYKSNNLTNLNIIGMT